MTRSKTCRTLLALAPTVLMLTTIAATSTGASATPPTIASFSPVSGAPGADVVITGTNFSNTTVVRFGGVGTSFAIDSPTKITAQVPILHNSSNPSPSLITIVNLNEPSVNSADTFAVTAVGGTKKYESYTGAPDPQNWFDSLLWKPNGVPGLADIPVVENGGGTLRISGTGTTTLAGLNLLRPTLERSGNLIVTGTLNMTNTTFSGAGTTTIPSSGTLNIFGTFGNTIAGGTLNNSGKVHLNSGSLLYAGSSSPVINNLAGGIFEIRDGQAVGLNGIGTFTNTGTVTKPPTSGRADISANFTNMGLVEAPSGTLRFGSFNQVTGNGAYDTGLNGLIHFDSTTTFETGTVLSGFSRSTATLHLSGDTNIGKTGKGGVFELADGTLDGAGKLSVLGSFNWSGGDIGGTGEVAVASGSAFNISGGFKSVGARTFNVAGGTVWSGTGTVNITNNAFVFNNLSGPGAVFVVLGDGSMGTGNGGIGIFQNTGDFVKSNGTGTTFIGPTFTNAGTLSAQSGTLRFANFTQTSGSTDVGNIGIAATLASDNPLKIQGGTLRGNGTLKAAVNNTGGGISIGTATSTATLNISGNYTQGAGGALNFRIGGTSPGTKYDQLNLTGTAALSGALNVSMINNFVPTVGATFILINNDAADFVTDTFSGLPEGALINAGGKGFRISYVGGSGNDVTLTAVPVLSISDRTLTEGNSGSANANFTVILSAADTQAVTVQYATSDGTATASKDYTAQLLATLTFAPGETTKLVTVPIMGDLLDEDNETFFVNLSNATNAVIADDQGLGTITDNDAAPSLTIGNAPTKPEGSAAVPGATTFTITLGAASGQTVIVAYQTADGTAKAGSDYVIASGTLTFAPGETSKTVTVNFIGDSEAELAETLFLDLKTPTNATIAKSRGSAYIRNDDGPGITIDNAATVDEGNTGTKNQAFTVHLSAASTNTVTVDWTTANNTAGPADYVVANGKLTFAPGQTSKIIVVQVKGDTLVESTETYRVNLSSPTYAVLADSQGVAYIRNDDTATLTADEPNS